MLILLIVYIITTVSGLVLMKMGGSSLNLTINNFNFNFSIGLKTLLGLTCYVMSFLLWMFILSKSDTKLSVLFPVVGAIVQILVIASGIIIFKENLNFIQISGIILTMIGIILITYSKG